MVRLRRGQDSSPWKTEQWSSTDVRCCSQRVVRCPRVASHPPALPCQAKTKTAELNLQSSERAPGEQAPQEQESEERPPGRELAAGFAVLFVLPKLLVGSPA